MEKKKVDSPLLRRMALDIEEKAKAEQARQEKAKVDALADVEALKVAEAKEALRANAFDKCGETGKAATTLDLKVEEADDDLELAKETLKIAVAKRIEVIKKCIAMEVPTKEVNAEGAFIMEKVLDADEVDAISEGMKVSTTTTTKARAKGGHTKEDLVLEAIKGGNNTKKGLEAPDAGFDGDVHGQTYTLTKKGLIKATAPGVYEVV